MADDYYATLGVSRSATAEEIQKAYRRLARKHHPDLAEDKDAAKQKFQQVQHAYDVLSDPQKRELYDRYGPDFAQGRNPFQGGQAPNGMDMEQIFGGGKMPAGGFEDILKQVFGGAGGGFPGGFPGGGRQGHGSQPRRQVKGEDVEQQITIPFATAVLGGKHQLSLQRSNGDVENITVSIPAGIADGKKIRLRGQGRSSRTGGPRGDMLVKVKIAPHPAFQRHGDNLLVELPITIAEAVNGAKIDLPTPHGDVTISVPANSSSGSRLRLKGMGVKQANGKASDLMVELRIVIPDDLTEEQKRLLQEFSDSMTDQDPRSEIAW